jgi:hypothetical protein
MLERVLSVNVPPPAGRHWQAAALAGRQDLTEAPWRRPADLVLAARHLSAGRGNR